MLLIFILIISVFSLIFSFLNFIKSNKKIIENLLQNKEEIQDLMKENFNQNRKENLDNSKNIRQEIATNLNNNFSNLVEIQNKNFKDFEKSLQEFINKFSSQNISQNNETRQEIEKKMNEMKKIIEEKLKFLQEDNNKKLEEMRLTVDEKLQKTVEERFDKSFQIISEQLGNVHKGLGEMQSLASGVGDLKKVLSNVKTRGNIGEIQLGAILEQFLPARYERNFAPKAENKDRVEFAIKIPNKDFDDRFLYLPIDSKFPVEDYQRLIDAMENVDYSNQQFTKSNLESARNKFESAVKKAAKDISEKYLNPPITTDFAIMFVPTEGLYAEILRNNLFEEIQKFNVIILGPTTIIAFLNALQMGFRTLTIEKKSSEVWKILGKAKTEFAKYGDVLEAVKKKIQGTVNEIDGAASRSRAIERALKDVEIDENLIIENKEE